jgi:hypothetical protein
MTSPKIIRDPLADHMLTPQNAALLKIPRRLVVDRIAALNISPGGLTTGGVTSIGAAKRSLTRPAGERGVQKGIKSRKGVE